MYLLKMCEFLRPYLGAWADLSYLFSVVTMDVAGLN
jgi:hypothetical protein